VANAKATIAEDSQGPTGEGRQRCCSERTPNPYGGCDRRDICRTILAMAILAAQDDLTPFMIWRPSVGPDCRLKLRGKNAQHAAAQRIDLFGEQAHVVAARKQTVEQIAAFRIATLQYVVIDKPEAAREKSAFVNAAPISQPLPSKATSMPTRVFLTEPCPSSSRVMYWDSN
jgi:hypothetical protein